MNVKDSEHFVKTTPENIIPLSMLDKWKRQDDGTVKAKSRCVLVGWKDPMVYQLERAAPTPTQEAIMVTLQWLASAKMSGKVHRLDQRVWTVTQDITEKQARNTITTWSDTPIGGTRTVVAGRN